MPQASNPEQDGNEDDPIKPIRFNPTDYFYYWFLKMDNSLEKDQDS